MNPTEIRSATTAQMNAHLASMRGSNLRSTAITFALVIGVLGGGMCAALNSANTKFAAEDLRNQETRLAWVEAR